MAWVYDSHDLEEKVEQAFFCEGYLDSPVLITPRSQYLIACNEFERLTKYRQNPRKLSTKELRELPLACKKVYNLFHIEGRVTDYSIVDPDEYPLILSLKFDSTGKNHYQEASSLALRVYNRAGCALATWMQGTGGNLPITPDFSDVLSKQESSYYDRWAFWNAIVTTIQEQFRLKKHYAVRVNMKCGFVITNTEMVHLNITDLSGNLWKLALTWSQLLMFKDSLYSRAQALTAARVLYPNDHDLPERLEDLFNWHELCLKRYGNDGFNISKNSEALSKAYLSVSAQDAFGDRGPYARMIEKIKVKEEKIPGYREGEYVVMVFDQVLRSCRSTQHVVELFGLHRVSCHPLIYPEAGGLSAAEQAKEPDRTHAADAQEINWNFKRIFLESFLRKERRWPVLEFEHDAETELRQAYRRQTLNLHRGSYPLSDWSSCRFGKLFDIDTAPNFLEFMDDKSIAHYRTNIAANWDPKIESKSHRRLLMEMLSRKEIDLKAVFAAVMRREIPFDWFIVCLFPKERELKPEPRMFSMMVFEMRAFFTVLEANLADQVFPYLPQQTMTKDRLSVNRMFMDLTRPSEDPDALHMFLEVDLSRWNLRWRELTVHTVGSTLDDMFGSHGIFTFVHEFFRKSMIVVRVAGLVPDGIDEEFPPEGPLLWYDHLGGFEGIAQKHWTICTYSMVDLAVQDFALSYILIGQADNQVLSVKARRAETVDLVTQLEALRDQLTVAISDGCLKVNQIVKPEECLESTKVITYSKDIYIDGVYYPTSLKFNSRLFPHSSQDFPSIRTNTGAIFSSALTGAEKSAHPLRGYYLACMHASAYLLGIFRGQGLYSSNIAGTLKNKDTSGLHDFVEFMLTLPSELGGYPILTFVHFIYKGGSDPLSKSLASLVLLQRSGSRLHDRMLAGLSSDEIYSQKPEPVTLMKDPYSIPLRKPVTAIDGVTQETMARLRNPSIMKNDHIRQLVEADTSGYSDKLIDALSTARPFNPLILRDILECSVKGIVDTIGKMFVATRTLQNVARESSSSLISLVFSLELEAFEYMKFRFNHLPNGPWKVKSIFSEATSLRDRWTVAGIPAPEGVTSHVPFDFSVETGVDAAGMEGVVAVLASDHDVALTTRGAYDPYVGSKTREKRSEHGYKIVGTDTTSQSFRKLQLISSQTGGDPALRRLIDLVGLSRSETILSEISPNLTGVSGGNLIHRYAARAGYQESFGVGSPNFATHCLISSDRCEELTGGVHDYPVMFQEFFLAALWILQFSVEIGLNRVRAVCIKLSAKGMVPLPESVITIDPEVEIPHISFRGNPLAYLSSIDIKRISGYTGHRSLGVGRQLDAKVGLTRDDKRIIVEGWFREVLRANRITRIAADISSSLHLSETIDIAEARGCGIDLLIQAAANVVSDEISLSIVRGASNPTVRLSDRATAIGLSEILTGTFAAHIGHPQLLKDHAVIKYRLVDSPNYFRSTSRPHHRLAAVISSRAISQLRTDRIGYYMRRSGVFESESSMGVFQVYLTTFARTLYMLYSRNHVERSDVRTIVNRFMLPIMRSDFSEYDKISALLASASSLLPWLRNKGLHVAAEYFTQIESGRVIHSLAASAKDALRLTRPPPDEDLPTRVYRFRNRVRASKLPASRPRITDNTPHSHPCGPTAIEYTPETRESLSLYRMLRNTGRDTDYGQSSVSVWIQLSSVFLNRSVTVIGSGQGSVATAAILSGCTHVYGLDLGAILPLRPHRFTSYCPPAVVLSGGTDKYTQIPLSYTAGGDWFDREVSDQVCATYDSGDTCFVLDLESSSHRFGAEVLDPIIRNRVRGPILMRVFWTDHECDTYMTAFERSGYGPRIWDIAERTPIRARIIYLKRVIGPLLFSYPPDRYEHNAGYLGESIVSESDYPALIGEAIFGILPIEDDATLTTVLASLLVYRRSLVGVYESRMSYDRWTLLLRAILSIWWVVQPVQDRVRLIHDWSATGLASFPMTDHRFDVNYDLSLEHHLTTIVSRLASKRDRLHLRELVEAL